MDIIQNLIICSKLLKSVTIEKAKELSQPPNSLRLTVGITKTKLASAKSGANIVVKQKTGDKLPFNRLAKESTNLTDALKYYVNISKASHI